MVDRQQHLETEELVFAATNRPTSPETLEHLANCAICQSKLGTWEIIATATNLWADGAGDIAPSLRSGLISKLDRAKKARTRPLQPVSMNTRDQRRVWKYSSAAAVLLIAVVITVIVSVGSSTPSTAAILKQLRAATLKSNAAGTVHIETTEVAVTGDFPPRTIHFDLDGSTRSSALTEKFSLNGGFFGQVLRIGTHGYTRYTNEANPPLDTPGWYEFSDTPLANPEPVPSDSPGGIQGVIGTVRHLGTAHIDGVPATGYQVTISVASAIRKSPTTSSQTWFESLQSGGVRSYVEEVWLDNKGRERELRWRYKTNGDVFLTTRSVTATTFTEIYSYGNKVLSVSPPPQDDTTPAPNFELAGLLAHVNEVLFSSSGKIIPSPVAPYKLP